MEYYTYSNVAGATYASISDFKNNAMIQIKSVAQRMGTNTKFVEIGEHLYLVRNLVTSDYNPYAIIVMEINKSKSIQLFIHLQNSFFQIKDCGSKFFFSLLIGACILLAQTVQFIFLLQIIFFQLPVTLEQ